MHSKHRAGLPRAKARLRKASKVDCSTGLGAPTTEKQLGGRSVFDRAGAILAHTTADRQGHRPQGELECSAEKTGIGPLQTFPDQPP
jgi:hypothetical protein